MPRVFVTGSADGLGRLAAQTLLAHGHDVVLHVRNGDRLDAVRDLVHRGAVVVVGDLSDSEQTRGIARDVNALGRMDAVIHNAGVYTGTQVMPVNIIAPYLLTALIDPPAAPRLPQQRQPLQRAAKPGQRRLERSSSRFIFGQQAVRHNARRGYRSTLAGCVQQRRRPRLGTHKNGRTRRPRRPTTRTPHAGVARHERRPRGAHLRRLLVPPAPTRPASSRRRTKVPGPTARRSRPHHQNAPRPKR